MYKKKRNLILMANAYVSAAQLKQTKVVTGGLDNYA